MVLGDLCQVMMRRMPRKFGGNSGQEKKCVLENQTEYLVLSGLLGAKVLFSE